MEQASAPQPKDDQDHPLDFFSYVASLAYQAMVFLGEMPSPTTGQIEKNREQAKLLIDTLILLRDKTTGNLTDQEKGLLDTSIYELQIKYVQEPSGSL